MVKDILDSYEKVSSQQINFDKSVIFFSSNVEDSVAHRIVNQLGVRSLTSMERCLGLPTLVGRNKRGAFSHLCDRMRSKVSGWANYFLSQGGKEVYIKCVLQALSTYSMSCFLFPKALCHELKGITSRF